MVVDGLGQAWAAPVHDEGKSILDAAGMKLAGDLVSGAGPNAPREDVFRIANEITSHNPDVVISVGGGSGIDAVKAAIAYSVLGDKQEYVDRHCPKRFRTTYG